MALQNSDPEKLVEGETFSTWKKYFLVPLKGNELLHWKVELGPVFFLFFYFYPQKHNKVNGLLCHKFSGMRQRDRITLFALFYDLSIGFTIHPHQLKLENMFLSPHCCKFLHNVYFSQLNFL